MKKDLVIHARTTHVTLATLVKYAEMTTGLPRTKAEVVNAAVELVAQHVAPKLEEQFTTASAKEYLERVLPTGGVRVPRNLYSNLLEEELGEFPRERRDELEEVIKQAVNKRRNF